MADISNSVSGVHILNISSPKCADLTNAITELSHSFTSEISPSGLAREREIQRQKRHDSLLRISKPSSKILKRITRPLHSTENLQKQFEQTGGLPNRGRFQFSLDQLEKTMAEARKEVFESKNRHMYLDEDPRNE